MIVAIDGLSGTGKSSVAERVASELGFRCMDTGAIFRALAWKILYLKIDIGVEKAVVESCRKVQVEFKYEDAGTKPQKVFCDGFDVTSAIRTSTVDDASSVISTFPGVRAVVLECEHKIACDGDYVVDGRDIGTVVFPDAEVKFFLTASPEEKARRRAKQNAERGIGETDLDVLVAEMSQRDQRDASRAIAPCVPADDAIIVDTDGHTLEEVAEIVIAEVKRKI